MAGEYQSSEELQRHNADKGVFADEAAKKAKQSTPDAEKGKRVLDLYIAKYSNTATVREEAKKNGRTNGYQLDLSADMVIVLTKIKSELG